MLHTAAAAQVISIQIMKVSYCCYIVKPEWGNIFFLKIANLKKRPLLAAWIHHWENHFSSAEQCLNVFLCLSGASWQAGWEIYNWTDTGYGILIYVTPVSHYHALWFWMQYLLRQCGVTVWEASCCSHPSWEWQGGRIDCDSSHCSFATGLFLPLGSCCCFTGSKCTRCHLSGNIPFLWGTGWGRSCGLGQ